jgi:hypothetical protein
VQEIRLLDLLVMVNPCHDQCVVYCMKVAAEVFKSVEQS